MKIIPRLSMDLRVSSQKVKDLAVVNQYMALVMEAKKQGRKERRSKEAQAVLAAASAVAATSSRSGSLRKDVLGGDDKSFFVRESFCTPTMPPTSRFSGVGSIARPGILKSMGNGHSSPSQTSSCGLASSFTQDKLVLDSKNYGSELSSCETRETPALCDICKDPSRLNAIITCQRCKVMRVYFILMFGRDYTHLYYYYYYKALCFCYLLQYKHQPVNNFYILLQIFASLKWLTCDSYVMQVAVHQQCYPFDSVPSGDWHCQPCSEILQQYQGSKVPEVTDRATPGHEVVCSKCLQRSGAFVDNGRSWVHVFCAQVGFKK